MKTLKRDCKRLGYLVSRGRKDDSSELRYCGQVGGKSIMKFGASVTSVRQLDSCACRNRCFAANEFSGKVSSEQTSHSLFRASHAVNAFAQGCSNPGAMMKSRASESPDPAPTILIVVIR